MKILLPFQDPYNRPLEYPICSGGTEMFCKSIYDNFDRPFKLKKLGYFKEDKLFIEDIAKLAPKAQEIIDTVYW